MKRGGLILRARYDCNTFDATKDEHLRTIAIAIARDLATRNACPLFAAFDAPRDAYRSRDIEDDATQVEQS